MAAAGLGAARLVQPLRQQQRGHVEANQLAGLLHRHAHIHHLDTHAAGQGHELAARERRRGQPPGDAAGHLGLQAHLGARHALEQRRVERRIGRRQDLQPRIAPLDAADLALAAQQRLGQAGPGRAVAVAGLQALQPLQHQLGAAADLALGSGGLIVGAVLRTAVLVAQRQHHQQRLRHHQQNDQRHPQQQPR